MQLSKILTGVLLGGLTIVATPVSAQEVTLKVYSATPETMMFTQMFFKEFLEPVNAKGAGKIKLEFTGGPEVMAPANAADALERGIFDIAFIPAGYYTGKVPEGLALAASSIDATEARATGAMAMIEEIWAKKLNAKLLSWGSSDSGYNIYLIDPPTSVSPDKLSLEGMKIRSGSVYRPVVDTFGATPVTIPVSELFTSLQSGLVDGTGWAQVGLIGSGAEDVLKYRIDPPFFRNSELVIMNLDKWNSLSDEARAVLAESGIAYETASNETMAQLWIDETAQLKEKGLQIIQLEGAALDTYVNNSRALLWKSVTEKVEDAEALGTALKITE